MKRNLDSIRAVLLYLEDNQKIGVKVYSNEVVENILKNNGMNCGFKDDILYAIKQLCDDRMIDGKLIGANQEYFTTYYINDITPRGHDFLENIRDDGVWKETKTKAKDVGSFAINFISQIASSIISSKLTGL